MTIHYPFETSPELGSTLEVVPGVHWLRMPLPFLLGHINLWLLNDGDTWSVVDTGIHTAKSRDVWKTVFEREMKGQPVSRVIITHLHPDHVGCAGWLTDQFDADLWMSRVEYFLCRILVADTGKPAPPEGLEFYRSAGFADSQLHQYEKLFGRFGQVVSHLPESYRRLTNDMTVEAGSKQWRVVVGRGHSPEHACLFCEKDNVIISGDQILPTISSNISVHPTEPDDNPLADWLESLAELKQRLPEDVLVLPSHGRPFRGVHQRLDDLTAEHIDCLEKLHVLCQQPRRAVDVFPALFKSEINDTNLIMATGESIAHINYLLHKGELSCNEDESGVKWYQA
jgi:glyoxylase-like metal-dependent hydrolase (beta-lactamase superfamily II)